jgi:hypothetical protein
LDGQTIILVFEIFNLEIDFLQVFHVGINAVIAAQNVEKLKRDIRVMKQFLQIDIQGL